MLGVVGDLLPYSVPVALSPLPVIAVLLLLLGPGGNDKGLCFLAGRIAAMMVLVFLASLFAGWADQETGDKSSSIWLRLCLGLLLIALAVRTAVKPAPDEELPGWMLTLDRATPLRAAGLGVLLTVANLKELAFIAGAGILLGAAELPAGQAAVCAVIYSFLSALGVAMPVGWACSADEAGKARLIPLRDWLVANRSFVMAAVLLFIGVLLTGGALAEF